MIYPIVEYDPTRNAIIEPSKVVSPRDTPEHCVICFFREVIDKVVAGHAAQCRDNRGILRIVDGKGYRDTAPIATTSIDELGTKVDGGSNRKDTRSACVGNACDSQHVVGVGLPEATGVAAGKPGASPFH